MSRPNLLSLLDSFAQFGGDTAVVETRGYRRESLTYAQLRAHALSLSLVLAGQGIGPADRILLWGRNSASWVVAFWAIQLCGAVAVPMDAAANLEFVQRIVREAQVKLILRDGAQPALQGGPPSLLYNDCKTAVRPSAPPAAAPGGTAERTAVAEILFTSGTTSEPRGVVLTHGNFLANLEPIETSIEEYRKYERWLHPLRFVSLVPLSHVFGQFMSLFVPPLLGATVVFENSPHPVDILRSIRRERATVLIAVPRMLDALRHAIEQDIDSRGWRTWFNSAYAAAAGDPFLRSVWRFRRLHRQLGWRFWAFISGGATLCSPTEEFFKRIGFAVVQGYGMTETASLISLNHPFKAQEGTVGKILPGREFRIAPDGEILIRGENVSSGYFEKGAFQSPRAENEGWLGTGDLGELDAEGSLRLRGRKKNVIVTSAGLNVYPEDLEVALRRQPAIRDAVVIPYESASNSEPLAILLVQHPAIRGETKDRGNPATSSPTIEPAPLDPSAPPARSAIEAANSSLAEYQRIRRWLLWPEPDFPRTPTGKPRLAVMASRAGELLGSSRSEVIPSSTRELSASSFSLPSSDALSSMSSLDRVELLSTLEQRYNVEINETQFANAQSAADLERLIAQNSARLSDYAYPRWTQRAPVRLIRTAVYYALTWPATLLLAHARILGREHLTNRKGPFLFVANHTTRRADIGLVLIALPARFRHRLAAAMGGEQLRTFRHPPPEWFFAKRWLWRLNYFLVISLFNVFPLPQLSGFRESFRYAGESVDRGYSILVFPEGIINERDNPDMIPFQPGIGLLATNLNIPVIPMRIDGLWQMQKERRRLAHPGEVVVHIGAPVSFPPNTPPAEIASRLHSLVRSL
jgi:long-chain acyl-CoA synthetase